MVASRNNDADVISILLEAKADPYIKNKNEETASGIAQNMHTSLINTFPPLLPGLDLSSGMFLFPDDHLDAIRALEIEPFVYTGQQQQSRCVQNLSE